jgi:hypothetical protein
MADAVNAHRAALDRANRETEAVYAAWRRELSSHIAPKRHLIDALVIGTRNVVAQVNQAAAINSAVAKWKHDAAVARTIGTAEPSIMDYLPQDPADG